MFLEGLVNQRHRIEKVLSESKTELHDFREDLAQNRIKSDMKKIITKLSKNKDFNKEIINQLVNRIEIDKDKNAVIYFNFYELNCLGGQIDGEPKNDL